MNFYTRIDRINQYINTKIRARIIVDGEIDFNYLKLISDDLQYENIISSMLNMSFFTKLHDCYIKRLSIEKKVLEIDLYISDSKKLIAQGIFNPIIEEKSDFIPQSTIKDINGVNIDLLTLPPEYTIRDDQKFKLLCKKTLKEFTVLILFKKRINFLKSLLDEISQKGLFSHAEIKKIKDNIDLNSVKINKYLKTNSSLPKENKIPNPNNYKTFYLDDTKAKYDSLFNESDFLSGFKMLRENGLICPDTKPDDFKLLFQSKELQENQLIRWNGTFYQLKIFINAICKPEICNQLSEKTLDKWYVALKCFTIKKKGKWIRIQKYQMISNSSRDKNDTFIIEKFASILEKLLI